MTVTTCWSNGTMFDSSFRFDHAAVSHLPLEGGGRRSVARREPGGGEAASPHPGNSQNARCRPSPPGEGEARVMLGRKLITRNPYNWNRVTSSARCAPP